MIIHPVKNNVNYFENKNLTDIYFFSIFTIKQIFLYSKNSIFVTFGKVLLLFHHYYLSRIFIDVSCSIKEEEYGTKEPETEDYNMCQAIRELRNYLQLYITKKGAMLFH